MIVTVEEAKEWLRVDISDEDNLITMLINAAQEYLANATGNQFDGSNHLAKLFVLVLVADWFENRQMVGKISESVRQTAQSMLTQLSYCYPSTEGGESTSANT